MSANRCAEPVLAGVPRRLDCGQDASSRRVQLLIARSPRAQLELTGAIAGEARVRVAVDEPGERAQAPPVERGASLRWLASQRISFSGDASPDLEV